MCLCLLLKFAYNQLIKHYISYILSLREEYRRALLICNQCAHICQLFSNSSRWSPPWTSVESNWTYWSRWCSYYCPMEPVRNRQLSVAGERQCRSVKIQWSTDFDSFYCRVTQHDNSHVDDHSLLPKCNYSFVINHLFRTLGTCHVQT